MSAAAPDAVIQRVVAALERAAVPYMLTGSFASSTYGVARATQDVDFVIAPTEESLESLLAAFPEDRYYVSREAALGALERESLFNLVDFDSGWKIDFILLKSRAFSHTEFGRRIEKQIFGGKIQVASAEDIILAKLEWAQRSGSDRQIEDAAGVLRAQQGELDLAYVATWVAALQLQPQWEAALAASKGSPRSHG